MPENISKFFCRVGELVNQHTEAANRVRNASPGSSHLSGNQPFRSELVFLYLSVLEMVQSTLASVILTSLLFAGSLVDASPPRFHKKPPVGGAMRPENTTHTFKPSLKTEVDRKDPKNLVPAKNISLSYAPAPEEDEQKGGIDMSLVFNEPAVALEHVEAVAEVVCDDNSLSVTFEDKENFDEAVSDWDTGSPFVLITGSFNKGCTSEFERGFFVVDSVSTDAEKLAVKVTAVKGELPDIAGGLEMSFTSLPAAQIMRRIDLDPEYAIDFEESLDEGTTIFSSKDGELTAEKAWFSSTVTFSGRLKYNFWTAKLEELVFDLDAEFEASAVIAAQFDSAFSTGVVFSPDELAFSLVDVPGIIALGPGVAFGLSVDLDVKSATDLYAGVDVALPAGKVHIDFLDGNNTESSGWEPEYESFANITKASEVQLDIGPAVTVALQFKLLGGLVDLSSGIRAVPGFGNNFKLRRESADDDDDEINLAVGMEKPEDAVACTDADTDTFEYASDFFFKVTAFATRWWDKDLYEVRVPIADHCVPL